MLPLVPHAELFAVGASTPFYTHFVFMVGHAGWIHWACNSWSLIVLHNIIKWYRLLVAYICSVMLSFILVLDKPVIGASVIVTFLMGMLARQLYIKSKLSFYLTVSLLVFSCFLPGFAGIYHIILFLLGVGFYRIEFFVRRILGYINDGKK